MIATASPGGCHIQAMKIEEKLQTPWGILR